MADHEKIIIDDTNEKWEASVEFYGCTTAWLSFRTKPAGMPIQGSVDGTLGWKDKKTGINDLIMMLDDGSFIVDFSGYTEEQARQIRQPLLEYFKTLYETNKEKFAKRLSRDIKDYEDLANTVYCQSCHKSLDKRKPKQFGTETDGAINFDYCVACYKKSKFTEELTMEQMIDRVVDEIIMKHPLWDKDWHKNNYMSNVFPKKKRWKK